MVQVAKNIRQSFKKCHDIMWHKIFCTYSDGNHCELQEKE